MPSRKPCKRPRQKALAGRTKSSPEKQAATDRETNIQIASRLQVPRQNGPRCSWLQESTCGQKIKAGKSGNPRGRPKGRRNVATMTKDILNRHIKVRSEGKTVEMRAVEAIFRVLANGAAQGNIKAASLFNRLRDMAGLGSDLTEEELQKHVMRLPRGFSSPEETDLCWAPAREKDRQRYLAMAELDETSPDPETRASNAQIPPSIKA